MPARRPEVVNAKEEGIRFLTCTNPVKVLGSDRVKGIECVRMEPCECGEDGRGLSECVRGSEFTVEADVFIGAIGPSPNPLLVRYLPDFSCGRKGNAVVDGNGRTSIPHVFAAGDIATGAATVIWAMGGAKKAARKMDAMLCGKDRSSPDCTP
jgi:glutamate synthase (NADPH/NADH) small chain